MLEDTHMRELRLLANALTPDNIGDSMRLALILHAAITSPKAKANADELLYRIKRYSINANVGWRIFKNPINVKEEITSLQIWQLIGVSGALTELSYCFDRIEEASLLTHSTSSPVRFYVNGIFHYVTALFLLDAKKNKKIKLPYPGTIIKVLHPMGLSDLLDQIYDVLNRPFGKEFNYGQTIRELRNSQFVHGSFSPANIGKLVKDSNIFDERQKSLLTTYHRDLYNRIVILRLQIIAILNAQHVDPDKFTPGEMFGL